MFAGDIYRDGAFAEYALVDERIVGRKPSNLNWSAAAALPLTSLTVCEAFLDQLKIPMDKNKNAGKVILITGGAGGVATAAVEFAKKVLGLTVVATGSRDDSIKYVKSLGADHVVNHHQSYIDQLKDLGIESIDYVLDTHGLSTELFDQSVTLLKPFGGMVSIMPYATVNVGTMHAKALRFSAVLMFIRPTLKDDEEMMKVQHDYLNLVAGFVEAGILTSKETENLPFTLENLVKALTDQQAGKSIGKRTLTLKD